MIGFVIAAVIIGWVAGMGFLLTGTVDFDGRWQAACWAGLVVWVGVPLALGINAAIHAGDRHAYLCGYNDAVVFTGKVAVPTKVPVYCDYPAVPR